MHLHLVAINPELVTAWDRVFFDTPDVSVHQGNILDLAEDTLVSPANSYGDMGGGIDRVYRTHFGPQIEQTVQAAIRATGEPYLPVGSALLVPTGDTTIPRLIVAPTMFLPEPIPARNCFDAMRAILDCYDRYADQIEQIYCPGLGTGVGQVDPMDSAREMKAAYLTWRDHRDESE